MAEKTPPNGQGATGDERLCNEKKLSGEVNPTALTQLVIEHLQMAKAAGNAIERLEKLLVSAAVPDAKNTIEQLCPGLSESPVLEFALYKLHFFNLVLKDDISTALAFSRSTLAPMAIEAYPDAYSEFKSSMLAILDCHDKSVHRDRTNLTRAIISTVRSHTVDDTVINDSRLSLLLKYLSVVSRHPTYDLPIIEDADQSCHLGAASELIKLVISDEYVQPLEVREVPHLSHIDKEVQNLAQSLAISREDAIMAIRLAKGSSARAFRNVLGSMKIDHDGLTKLSEDFVNTYNLKSSIDGMVSLEDSARDLPRRVGQMVSDGAGADAVDLLQEKRFLSPEVEEEWTFASALAVLSRSVSLMGSYSGSDLQVGIAKMREATNSLAAIKCEEKRQPMHCVLRSAMVAIAASAEDRQKTCGDCLRQLSHIMSRFAEALVIKRMDAEREAKSKEKPVIQSMLDELAYVHSRCFYLLHMRPDTLITTLGPTVCELFEHLAEGAAQGFPSSPPEMWRGNGSHSSGTVPQEKVSALSEDKENKVMMIMEITTMARREALRLLENHRWNIEQTLHVYFHGL